MSTVNDVLALWSPESSLMTKLTLDMPPASAVTLLIGAQVVTVILLHIA